MAIGNKAGTQSEKPFVQRAAKFFRDARVELRKVHWPTRKELTAFTLVVLFISAVTTVMIGLFDFGFAEILRLIGVLGR